MLANGGSPQEMPFFPEIAKWATENETSNTPLGYVTLNADRAQHAGTIRRTITLSKP
jgi:hypothetical protein